MPSSVADRTAAPARRVILVVLDGLRAELVHDARFPNLGHLRASGASTTEAVTVLPSVTACAMTSLLTGVAPARHGVMSDRFALPRLHAQERSIGRMVADAGLPVTGIVRQVPWLIRPLAARMVSALGLTTVRFAAPNAHSLLHAARPALTTQADGLIIIHWPDCDTIGHRTGWMSPAYLAAVARMDQALGTLLGLVRDGPPDTLLVALADHGGGGRVPTHHDSAHPFDCTIPIMFSGTCVEPQRLRDGLTLLDVPATILAALGICIPASYDGTPIAGVFRHAWQSAERDVPAASAA